MLREQQRRVEAYKVELEDVRQQLRRTREEKATAESQFEQEEVSYRTIERVAQQMKSQLELFRP